MAYVNPSAFVEMIDSILVHLNSDTERATGQIRAEDILANQQDEIKVQYRSVEVINFGLNYICDFNEKTHSFLLNPFKIRRFIGQSLLIIKGDFQLSEF